MKLPKPVNKIVAKVVNSVSQTSNKEIAEEFTMAEGIDKASRQAAAESMVLLKNDGVLPVTEADNVALFGRVQGDTFYVGYGSGGDVNPHYKVSFTEGLENAGVNLNTALLKKYNKWRKKHKPDDGFWGNWPMCYDEMPLDEKTVKEASEKSTCAFVFIGRAAGEDRENTLTKGSFYLTDEEENMLSLVSSSFERWTVILNIGNIIDFSWAEKYSVPSILIAWQGGMEAGNALADIVTGKENPSGSLTDTIAKNYSDIPSADNFGGKDKNTYAEDIFVGYRYFETFSKESVMFPFGFGLSYTDFSISNINFSVGNDTINISASIKNTGTVAGKKAVQLYCAYPETILNAPAIQLKAFTKTKLLSPGEEQTVTLSTTYYDISSYDDSGISGYKSSYVITPGEYSFLLGFDVRNTVFCGKITKNETQNIVTLSEASSVQKENAFMRLRPLYNNGKTEKTFDPAPIAEYSLKKRILSAIPETIPMSVGLKYTLEDVEKGSIPMERFVATLDYTELEAISRGDYVMNSPLGPKGNAGVFGGVLPSLQEKGIPPITTTDGPSGIRLAAYSALLPSGTALACSWNVEIITELYNLLGKEMRERGSDILLAPGMNIHRNPLCGRNFEYFSEDPVVTGNIAAAVVEGLQSAGVSACPKHFACNNQEVRRTKNDSVLSERALREIYLKGFEICVKKSNPLNLMTSYNKINGVWGHYNYDLVTTVLRGEWGFKGSVMTDWWMQSSSSPEFPELSDQAYRVRAGVNVLMPGGGRTGKRQPDGTLLKTLGSEEGITTGELQKNAAEILGMIVALRDLRK
ncbi:MAG: glycoside hydrolase family 3 C-terminal domain-containing protein [Clostridia bacterium]|nr:glycoside hydrolase family 3 C-terminal domain-containing protein [Clostridia bacterium]